MFLSRVREELLANGWVLLTPPMFLEIECVSNGVLFGNMRRGEERRGEQRRDGKLKRSFSRIDTLERQKFP